MYASIVRLVPFLCAAIACGTEVVRIEPPDLGDARAVLLQVRAQAEGEDRIHAGTADRPITIDLADGAALDLRLLAFSDPLSALMLPEPLRLAKDAEPAVALSALGPRGWSGSFEGDGFSGWTALDGSRIDDEVRVFDPSPDPCGAREDMVIEEVDTCARGPVCAVTAFVMTASSAWISTDEGRLLSLTPDGRLTPILESAPVYTAGHVGPSGRIWLARAGGVVARISTNGQPLEEHALAGAPNAGRVEELIEDAGVLYAATSSGSVQALEGGVWTEIHRSRGGIRTIRAAPVPGGVLFAGLDQAVLRIEGGRVTLSDVGFEPDDETTTVIHHPDLGTLVAIYSDGLLRSVLLRMDGAAWTPILESKEVGAIRDLIATPDLYFAGGLVGAGRHGRFTGARFCIDETFGAFLPFRVRRFGDGFLFSGRETPLLMPAGPTLLRVVRPR
jgi:hypothetical protein